LRLLGWSARLSPENPLGKLSLQVALTIPLLLPVVGAAALYKLNGFYPASRSGPGWGRFSSWASASTSG
jgi:hypothetical protein